jgi:preprotein translocase subunit YajC
MDFRARWECAVELQSGDYVRTEEGEVGKVTHISRMTVFVVLVRPGETDRIEAFLESQLTKVDRPVSMPQ